MQTTHVDGAVNSEVPTEGWKARLFSKLFPRTAVYGKLELTNPNLVNQPEQLWVVANYVVRTGLPIPPMEDPNEIRWVKLAMEFLKCQWSDIEDPLLKAIKAAFYIHMRRDVLLPVIAALMAKGGTAEAVAEAYKLDPVVVEAFSVLFFNRKARRWGRRIKLANYYLYLPVRAQQASGVNPREADLLLAGLYGKLRDVVKIYHRQGWTISQMPDRTGQAR